MEPDTESEIIGLETRYWQAMQDEELETALALTDFPCLVSGPQGVRSVDRATYESMMKTSKWKLHGFEIKEPQVRLLGDDTAVVSYRVHEEMTVDGQAKSLDAADSSTWVRRDGGWACAQHSEAIVGNPFGGYEHPDSNRSALPAEGADERGLLKSPAIRGRGQAPGGPWGAAAAAPCFGSPCRHEQRR